MINGYVMVTSHNFNKLSEKHIINLGYRLKYGTIWCRCLTNNYNKDYALQFEADSLVDFAQKHPDMDVTCLHIKLSLTQLCYETEAIFQDELKDKCPKTVYQYGPLIKEYVDLNAESSAKCLQLYQAANEEMTNAIKAYYQPFFDNFDATVANLKQLLNVV